jgi:hypothetical protein
MKHLTLVLGAVGMLALMAPTEAGGLKRSRITSLNSEPTPILLGECFTGNSSGDKAYENLTGDLANILPSMKPSATGGAGGTTFDLTKLVCIPDYLVIKGGNGYVVLRAAELAGRTSIDTSETCLRNGGGNAPTISHWASYGCEKVPEPASILAGLTALGMFALGRKRLA